MRVTEGIKTKDGMFGYIEDFHLNAEGVRCAMVKFYDGADTSVVEYPIDELEELTDEEMRMAEDEDYCPKSVPSVVPSVRDHNVGKSDYAKHKIQPWDIWIEYKLNPWDADIVKRVLRHKEGDTRRLDYEKIIHICQERIRQIDNNIDID